MRFRDAKDLKELVKMLDDERLKEEMRRASEPKPNEFLGHGLTPLRVGMLVRVNANGMLTAADAREKISAIGAVTRIINATKVWWSDLCVVEVSGLLGVTLTGMQELFLGRNGTINATKPTELGAIIQRVGYVVAYDAHRQVYRCRIIPDPVVGVVLGD